MSYFRKYAITLIAATFMVSCISINYVYAQSLDSQKQALLEKMEKEQKALAKLVAKTAQENISFDNPMDALKDIESQVLLDKNTPETVKNLNNIKESRYEMRREAIFQSFILGAKSKFDKGSSKNEIESLVELMKTMPGESEGSGNYTEVILAEMVLVMNYIRTELADIYREAAKEAAEIQHMKSAGAIAETFNMCQYYTERQPKKSLLDKAKGLADKAKNAYEKGTAVAAQASEAMSAVSEIKNTTQGLISEAQSSIPLKPEDLTGGVF